MRLREIFRFEVDERRRLPSTYLYPVLLLAVTLLLVAGGANPVVGSLFNAPVKIATFTLFIGLLGTLVTAGLFVEAGHRDARWRTEPLFCATPLRRREYLGGRFLGALLVNAIVLLAIPAGLLLGTRLPLVSPETLGPFRAEAYLLPYVIFLLPNLLVNAAVLFGVTVLTRRSLPGYLGALGLVAAYLLAVNLTVGIDDSPLAAMLDPVGSVALTALTKGWTRVEQNTRLIGLEGMLLWNRLLWTGVALGVLAFTYRRFRLAHVEPRARRRGAPRPGTEREHMPGAVVRQRAVAVPRAPRSFGPATHARQLLAVAGRGVRQTLLTRDFLLIALALTAFVLVMTMETMNDPRFGTPLWPLTQLVVEDLTGRFVGVLMALLTTFYAGELVWRERDAGIHEIGDSAPVPDWVPFAGRLLALAATLAALQGLLMVSAMAAQALRGYFAFEPGLYLRVLFGLQLPDYLLFAVLALLVHVLVNDKYVGHLAATLVFLAAQRAGSFGIEHNLLVYGSDPGWIYSDLSGFGPFIEPFVWFKLYWAAWALLLGITAVLFWVRGTGQGLGGRLRLAHGRLTRRAGTAAGGAVLLVLLTGGFVFYNTNVLNEYRTAWEADELLAEHERRYKRFEGVPQPWLTGMRLHVELYPDRREVGVRGAYTLVNRTPGPIDSIHLSSFPTPGVTMDGVRFDRPARQALEDATHGYRIYALERALQPGDSLQMRFESNFARQGFRNSERTTVNMSVVGNGTHLESFRLLPMIGYQRDLLELSNAATRREHGLAPAGARPSLHDRRAWRISRTGPWSDWIDFEAIVGTARDQIAVVPGVLQRSWTDGDRRYFHYRAETPILGQFGLMSAEYAVRETKWNGVTIRVLHHPEHGFNVDRIVRSAEASLDYLTEAFGPYPHRELSLMEFPRYQTFARAYPGQIVYSEGLPMTLARIDEGDAIDFDVPLLIAAHELAHQWWGHQVMGADVEGSQVLSETLAQYAALMVLERTHGAANARAFVRSLHLAYLEGRGTHATPEVPLLRTGDHDYIHYRKGAVVMYALREYIGEAEVNTALRRLVRAHARRGPPYPTTLDLYRELQAVAPDSLHHLLEDLLATITLWGLRTTTARAQAVGGGKYRVTIGVEAAKVRSDSVGNEVKVPMDDLVEIGVFADGARRGPPMYLGKHRIRSGRQTITITVPGRPARAGIDPYNRLIPRDRDALVERRLLDVTIEGEGSAGPDGGE